MVFALSVGKINMCKLLSFIPTTVLAVLKSTEADCLITLSPFFTMKNSSRKFFSDNKTEEGIEILRKIAAINGKSEEFEEKINKWLLNDVVN